MKQSVLKQFSLAYSKLTRAYTSGKIAYPRVSNNYIEDKNIKWYEYPHRPLIPFDEFSKPLLKEAYELTKRTLPLLLTNFGISTPATLMKNLDFIDTVLDDNLDIRECHADIMQDINYVVELIRNEAISLSEHEKKEGYNVFSADEIRDMELYELISYFAKDGEVAISDMETMPYRIALEPQPKMFNQEKEEKKLSVGKNNIAPLVNYPDEVTSRTIEIPTVDMMLKFEKLRNELKVRENSVEHIRAIDDNTNHDENLKGISI